MRKVALLVLLYAGMAFAQTPTRQPWGGTDFQVRDPDGNVISFVGYG